MGQRLSIRYSECFKRQVVCELESGRFASAEAARRHYGIGGSMTVNRWLVRYGKNHLLAKVVIVQTPDEKREIERLRKEVAKLERALGRAHVEGLLEKKFLELACRDMGVDVESFKKKVGGRPDTK